jgi:hypothetical protein
MVQNDEMKIPEHCSNKGEIVEGFGKIELLRTSIFSIVGIVIGLIIFIFTKNLVSIMLSLVGGSFCGYLFCKKDRYSRTSIVDSLIDMRNFSKSQKRYEYRRNK